MVAGPAFVIDDLYVWVMERDMYYGRFFIGLIVLTGVFYLVTLRSGQRAGDFAMYLKHTINLVEGRPYAETGYRQNPHALAVGGAAHYPPGTAFLLAPFYALFGLNFWVFKVVMVGCFMGGLYFFGRYFREYMEPPQWLLFMGLCGFLPYFWHIKENVQSDLPFLFMVALCFWLFKRLQEARPRSRSQRLAWLVCGLALWFTISLRTAGVVLVGAWIIYHWIRTRRLWLSLDVWMPVGICMAMLGLQILVMSTGSTQNYWAGFMQEVGSFDKFIGAILNNGRYYLLTGIFGQVFDNGYVPVFTYLLAGISFVLATTGYISRVRKGIGLEDVFVILYGVLLLIWPYSMPVYMLPVYVLFFYYLIIGLGMVAGHLPGKMGKGLWWGMGLMILGTFISRYTSMDFHELDQDVAGEEARALYEYIRGHTPGQALFISRAPRSLVLFTDRAASPPTAPAQGRDRFNEEEAAFNFNYFQRIGARYVVIGPKGEQYHPEVLPLWYMVQDYPDRFSRTYGNGAFELFELTSPLPATR